MALSMLDLDELCHATNLVAYRAGNLPYSGWHDDHREADGTGAYRPAIQQVRAEFVALLGAVAELSPRHAALQLGRGNCDAPHDAWRTAFEHVLTIDRVSCRHDDETLPGADAASQEAQLVAGRYGPYDMLFVDAGHSYADVARDHDLYSPLVRSGGVVAFHDALPRVAYPEVEVHRFLVDRRFPGLVTVGDEVGTAWYVKP